MNNVRVFPPVEDRVETGSVRFGDDWPGLFVRGDHCIGLAVTLLDYLADPSPINLQSVERVIQLFEEPLLEGMKGVPRRMSLEHYPSQKK